MQIGGILAGAPLSKADGDQITLSFRSRFCWNDLASILETWQDCGEKKKNPDRPKAQQQSHKVSGRLTRGEKRADGASVTSTTVFDFRPLESLFGLSGFIFAITDA